MDSSEARRRARSLQQEVEALFETLLGRSALFPGSLYEQKTQCGKANCRCSTGPYRHRLWCLSFVEGGRSRTRVVPKAMRPAVERWTRRYRGFRRARRELRKAVRELMAAVDVVGQARCKEGRSRYARLVAKSKGRRRSRRPTSRG